MFPNVEIGFCIPCELCFCLQIRHLAWNELMLCKRGTGEVDADKEQQQSHMHCTTGVCSGFVSALV